MATCGCTMMGVPTVTVSAGEMDKLMQAVERDPDTFFELDLETKSLAIGERKMAVDLPETYRSALTRGSWASTGLLRANLEEVRKTAAKLPYTSNFAG